MWKFLACFITLFISALQGIPANAQDGSASVFVYHRFGENDVPATNIRLDQFEAQLKMLQSNGYHFISLPDLVKKLKTRQPIPDKSIAFTVDDAYASVATEAWPRLKKAGIPLTIFVATDFIDRPSSRYLSWEQLRQLKKEGVHIAHHSASHLHMVDADDETVTKDIERANKKFMKEIGFVPTILSYPYGEYSLELKKKIRAMGFEAAFAQYSSPISSESDLFELPRFPVSERYGDIGRFKLISQARAIKVKDITPNDPVVQPDKNPPVYGFTVTEKYPGLQSLACYPSHLGKMANLYIIGDKRVEIRFDKPFPPGRNRINCTMVDDNGRWYWLGKLFYLQGGTLD